MSSKCTKLSTKPQIVNKLFYICVTVLILKTRVVVQIRILNYFHHLIYSTTQIASVFKVTWWFFKMGKWRNW